MLDPTGHRFIQSATNRVHVAIELESPDMRDLVRFLAGLVADLLRGRSALIAENGLLRQQLIVAERKLVGRVRWAPWQRFTMGLAVPTSGARSRRATPQ
jgi:hypothetical protein